MTNTVIHITHLVDRDLVNRLFAKFANKYGKLWTTRLGEGGNWASCADDWFQELSKFSFEQVRTAVNKALTIYRDFPPTQGQLIDLCLAESGVPEVQQLINLMISREFNHPLVKMVYDKIGSWALVNGKETEIHKKAKEAYNDCLAEFVIDPQSCWKKLEEYNARPKELPAPSKIPSTSESKAFRECMTKCQEILKGKKIDSGGKTYKQFDEKKIKIGGRDFDNTIYQQYKDYLLSIPEEDTLILPIAYIYERSRLIGQREQPDILRHAGYVPENQRIHKEPTSTPKRNNKPAQAYKSWVHD